MHASRRSTDMSSASDQQGSHHASVNTVTSPGVDSESTRAQASLPVQLESDVEEDARRSNDREDDLNKRIPEHLNGESRADAPIDHDDFGDGGSPNPPFGGADGLNQGVELRVSRTRHLECSQHLAKLALRSLVRTMFPTSYDIALTRTLCQVQVLISGPMYSESVPRALSVPRWLLAFRFVLLGRRGCVFRTSGCHSMRSYSPSTDSSSPHQHQTRVIYYIVKAQRWSGLRNRHSLVSRLGEAYLLMREDGHCRAKVKE